jgi:hypothetical protein
MYRREMLKYLLGTVGAVLTGGKVTERCYGDGTPIQLRSKAVKPLHCGWIDDLDARQAFVKTQSTPFLSQQYGDIKGSGKGKIVLLNKFFEEVIAAPLKPHYQEIGDCVSHAFGLGVDVLTSVRMQMFNLPEKWITKCATEIIYAGSRIEVGKGRVRGDGSMGVWASQFIKEWGVLLRQTYLNGKYDYTDYSGSVARRLGKTGVPDKLEPLCREHPVKTCSIVRSWEECRDAVANGYPVAMCSNLGFNTRRDKDGFLTRSRRPWYHAMVILGIDDAYKRSGALVQNSWGSNWVSGPTRHDQPAGSFWVDANVIDRGMRQGDSIALSGYVGYPRTKVPDYRIW